MTRRVFGKSRGQVAVLYTAALAFALAGTVGLGADVAVMYINWQQLQKGADAAALSGAGYLPNNSSTAQTTATTIAESDAIQSGEIVAGTPSVSANGLSLTVSASRTVPYNFLQTLGMTSQLMTVSATAGIQQNSAGGRGLMPIALDWPGGYTGTGCNTTTPPYTVGQQYSMQCTSGGSCTATSVPGNWGALALGGNGASVYQNNIEVGYNGSISCSSSPASGPSTETGAMSGPTQTGITDRVNAGAAADPAIAAGSGPAAGAALSTYQYDPRLVVAPMVDFNAATKPGKTPAPIVEFALIFLEGYSGKGGNATVNVEYLGTVSDPSSVSSAVPSFGILTPVLQN